MIILFVLSMVCIHRVGRNLLQVAKPLIGRLDVDVFFFKLKLKFIIFLVSCSNSI